MQGRELQTPDVSRGITAMIGREHVRVAGWMIGNCCANNL
jgi:hypothetical protein